MKTISSSSKNTTPIQHTPEWSGKCSLCGGVIEGNKIKYCRYHLDQFQIGFYHKECMETLGLTPLDPSQLPRDIIRQPKKQQPGYYTIYLTEDELRALLEDLPELREKIWRGSPKHMNIIPQDLLPEHKKLIYEDNKNANMKGA